MIPNNSIGLKSNEPLQNPFIMNPYRFAVSGVGGWTELARTTLGSSNATIDVTSLSDKRYYMILCNASGFSGGSNTGTQLNADTGSNYATRRSNNGGADYTDVSFSDMEAACTGTVPAFQVGYLTNKSDKEKLLITHLVSENSSGSGTAPFRNESVGKWANTSSAVSSYQWITSASTTFNSGSECVVLGWDPDDTHTDNFWEELGSETLASNTTGSWGITSFTPKKYLWVQIWGYASTDTQLRYGTGGSVDTGSNYAGRNSNNGGADNLDPNATHTQLGAFLSTNKGYANIFIINNSATEKLSIMHSINAGTSGAGNAPTRSENVSKWTNTSGQIDTIKFEHGSATWYAGCTMKVWGHD
jgi:hypothetical protein